MPENKSSESYSLGWVSVRRWPWLHSFAPAAVLLGGWVSSPLLDLPTADTQEGGQRLREKCDGHGLRSICPSVPKFAVCVHLWFGHLTLGASLMGLHTAVAPAFCSVPALGPAKQRRHTRVGESFIVQGHSLFSPHQQGRQTMGRGTGVGGGGAVSHQAMAREGALL